MTPNMSGVTRGYGLLEGVLARARARKANALIPDALRSGRILDVGCGQTPVFLLGTRFTEKYGVERAPNPVNDAGINLIAFDIARAPAFPFKTDSFDVVTMLAVLEHIGPSRLVAVLDEVYRVLKARGVFVLTTPAGWTSFLLRTMAKTRLVSAVEIEEHKHSYTQQEIADLFAKSDFDISHLRLGYFEFFMNNCGVVRKGR